MLRFFDAYFDFIQSMGKVNARGGLPPDGHSTNQNEPNLGADSVRELWAHLRGLQLPLIYAEN